MFLAVTTIVATIIVIFLALALLLAIGGAIARRRQLEATQGRFEADLAAVNRDLAEARAGDRGWDPDRMEAAVRRAWDEQAGVEPVAIELFRVVDRPGTDADEAVYRVRAADGDERLVTLGRRGDEWSATSVE